MSEPLTNAAFRLGTVQQLAVASAAGAAVSTAVFGAQTYAIRLCFPNVASSTGGVRYKIVSPTETAASSTADALLVGNTIEIVKVTAGQRVSAISNDAGTMSLSITELTK
jgi:hypothetical protein